MHEAALMQDLRRALDRVLAAEGPAEVRRVTLRVGALSHLRAAGLRDQWRDTFRGTPAETAELEVITSEDPRDPQAQVVVLESVVLGTPEPPRKKPPTGEPLHGAEGGGRPCA